MNVTWWMVFVVTVGVTAALAWTLSPALARIGLVAVPNARSSHNQPTVMGVGVVVPIMVGITTTAILHQVFWPLIAALTIAAVGFFEDLKEIPPKKRLLLQTALATISMLCLTTAPATVMSGTFLIVATINGLNFMDGINGITATLGILLGVLLAALGVYTQAWPWAVIGITLMAACLGYLPHNFPISRSFPGDVLPYFLAAAFVPGVLDMSTTSTTPLLSAGALAPAALDTGFTLIKRIRRGESATTPHRDHAYQRLARRTSHVASTALFLALATICSLGVLVGMHMSVGIGMLCTALAVVVSAFVIISIPFDDHPSALSSTNGAA